MIFLLCTVSRFLRNTCFFNVILHYVRELIILRIVDVDVFEVCVRVFWRQTPFYTPLVEVSSPVVDHKF